MRQQIWATFFKKIGPGKEEKKTFVWGVKFGENTLSGFDSQVI